MPSVLSKVATGLAIPVGLYAIILGALLTPYLQRFALYAHKVNTLFFHDIDDAQQFGFAKNQVTPFNIQTPDGETLYAWHILPIDVYTRNEAKLRDEQRSHGPLHNFTSTTAFNLLSSTDDSRVVVNFHGNAGHVAQGWRTDTYRSLTTHPNTHVLTVDYRGFGHSTGSPTEAGLITDGVALVNWVLYVAAIPPERIVLLGQSLGTAVASAVALEFADPGNALRPGDDDAKKALLHPRNEAEIPQPTAFASIILVAPFSNLPSLLLTYRIGGLLPILLPLRPIPWLAQFLTSQMIDQWSTAERLATYSSTSPPDLLSTTSLQILHAVDDADISYHQTEMICRRMLGPEADCTSQVLTRADEGRPRLRFEILGHGGHNRVVTYSSVAAAVVRGFEGLV